MNFIVIISDTLRRDHLGLYGNKWISTPHLDRFAERCVICDHAYTGSFPTIPHRTDVMTGQYCFTYTDWAPLARDSVVLSQVLGDAGYLTYMIVDTPHMIRDGSYFDRGFTGWQWIRGQENDRYMTSPADVEFPCSPDKLRAATRNVARHMRNTSLRQHEEDYFAPKTMRTAEQWLERNYRQKPFFLYVDTFDPHEPWDPPRYYADMYDLGYEGEEVTYPVYGPATYLTQAELKHMRALYAGEVTMVDRAVGRLLQKIEDLGLFEDTVIIFTTDHGFYLGEHNLTGKVVMLYDEVCHVPFMVHMPGGAGARRSSALVQAPDIMATLVELAGADDPGTMHGKSLAPLLKGDDRALREVAVSSWAIIHEPKEAPPVARDFYEWFEQARGLKPSTVNDGEWALICGAQDVEPELYHLLSDPTQERNVFAEHKDEAKRLHAAYVELLESVGTKDDFVARRRELPGA
ncbi:MAG: sulfatase [Armatimonadota bacterium]|nr:MAG: sulfatase [Armatimonadota bacterium]